MSESSSIDRLADTLRAEIAALPPGARLPASRDLVRRHGVSPVTVSRAIAVLAGEGAVVTRPGAGTYVAHRRTPPTAPADTAWQSVALAGRHLDPHAVGDALDPPPPGAITMSGGYTHRALQPTRALAAALARAARRPDAFDRAPTLGLEALRAHFARLAGTGDPADVLITTGGQSAISMIFRAVAEPGAPVLVESPTFPGALAAARTAGLRPVPVPIDDDGVRPDLLADAFAMTGARLFYCQPTFHNPTGAVLSPERRRQVADVARAAGAFLIEDDWARDLGHGGPVPATLVAGDRDGTVIHLTSLTKPAAPSLRVGAVIARGPVMARLRALRLVDDFFLARPLQEAAVELLAAPAWNRHLRALSTALRERRDHLATLIAEHLPDWTLDRVPAGGLHLWLRVPPGHETAIATARGVTTGPGRAFYAAEPPATHVRLGFAATAGPAELTEGVHRLRTAIVGANR